MLKLVQEVIRETPPRRPSFRLFRVLEIPRGAGCATRRMRHNGFFFFFLFSASTLVSCSKDLGEVHVFP